jgi:integrase
VLSEGDLRRVLGEIRRRPSRTRLGLKLILLTAARPGEVFGATFDEFEEERGGTSPGWWWTLPATRSKTGVAVRRPLSPQAAAIVEELRLLGDPTLIEPPRGRSPIAMRVRWALSLRKLAAKVGVADLRAHDLRRTAATMLARLRVASRSSRRYSGMRCRGSRASTSATATTRRCGPPSSCWEPRSTDCRGRLSRRLRGW